MSRLRRLRIYRWRDRRSRHGNFGDEITIPLLAKLFAIEAIPSTMRAAEFLGAGSILDIWMRASWKGRLLRRVHLDWPSSDLHVWGTGLMVPCHPTWPQRLHIHAVRGELTANQMDIRPVLGDPGILANLLLDRPVAKRFAVGLVAHQADIRVVRQLVSLPPNWIIISPEARVEDVLAQIAACEVIASSSLHGLITADSFGIPCVWLRTDRPLYGRSEFKFRDYESSRSSLLNEPLDYKHVVTLKTDEIAEISTIPGRVMEDWQRELIAAFPFQ
jgi:hypothetical protein